MHHSPPTSHSIPTPYFLLHITTSMSIPHLLLLLTGIITATATATATTTNITTLLSPYPNLSSFSDLLTANSLSSLSLSSPFSLLAVPNHLLHLPPSTTTSLPNLLRLHFLLSPLPSLSSLPQQIPTLLPSTSLNVSLDPTTNEISIDSATLISTVRSTNPNISIIVITSLLTPPSFALTSASASTFVPPVNITKALTDSHGFNVFYSILAASGLTNEFENDEAGAGLTIFVPTDTAFANIPPSADFQSLTSDQKGVVLRFHCLRSYYPLGSLQAIVNPMQPTLATEVMGAGKYTLNVTSVNGSVVLGTGIVASRVDETVFDENPVAIFGVPVVLLPKEIFGGVEVVNSKRGDDVAGDLMPEVYDAPPPPVGDCRRSRKCESQGSGGVVWGPVVGYEWCMYSTVVFLLWIG